MVEAFCIIMAKMSFKAFYCLNSKKAAYKPHRTLYCHAQILILFGFARVVLKRLLPGRLN